MSTTAPMTMLNVKIPISLKAQAKDIASDFGISVSAVVNDALRNFVVNRSITFEQQLVPNAKTAAGLKMSIVNIKAGKDLSPGFANAKDMDEYLDAL